MPILKRQYFDAEAFRNYKSSSDDIPFACNKTEKDLVKEFLQGTQICITTGHMAPDEYIDSVLRGDK